jgi:hypothetical protein
VIKSTLAHVALSVPLFAAGYGAAVAGAEWAAALAVALYWLGRELAQSMRPSAPFKINWTMNNTLGFGVPAALAVLAAIVL